MLTPFSSRFNMARVVHCKSFDCCPANRRETFESYIASSPPKVLQPVMLPGIEQRNLEASDIVCTNLERLFLKLTGKAAQGEDFQSCRASPAVRDHVIHCEPMREESLGGVTILAAIAGSKCNLRIVRTQV